MLKRLNVNILKYIFIVFSIAFAVPSIFFYINNKTILKFDREFCFLLNDSNRFFQTFVYVLIVTGLILFYYLIIKNKSKIFKNTKQIFIYILVISIIFLLTIPFWCSDIFYYLGIGRLYSEYNENPYYTTIEEYVQQGNIDLQKDTVMQKGYLNFWKDSTVVYGPIWTVICGIAGKLSMRKYRLRSPCV